MSNGQVTWDDESKAKSPVVKWDPPAMRAATQAEERQFVHGTPEYRRRIGLNLAEHGLSFLPTLGGTVGGLVGTPGGVVGSVGGAALGGAGGAAAEQLGRRYLFGQGPTTTLGAAGGIGKEAALQSLYEALGLGAGRAIKGGFRALGGTEKVGGIPMLRGERTGGRVPSMLERFFEHSIPTADVMARFRATQTAAVEAEADKLVQTISNVQGTPEQKGLLIRQAVEEARTRMSREVSQAYDAMDQMSRSRRVRVPSSQQVTSSFVDQYGNPITYSKTAYKPTLQGGAPVRPTAIRRAAGNILVELQKQKALLDPTEVEPLMKYLRGIRNSTDNIEFGAADKARSTLLNLTRKYEGVLGNRKTYILNQLEQGIDRDMDEAATRSGISGLDTQLKVARSLSREQHRVFEQRLVQKVMEGGNPETIAKVFRDAGLQELRDIGGIITPQQRRIIGASVMEDIMNSTRQGAQPPIRGLVPRGPRFGGEVFSKAINDLGDERGDLIFGNAWPSIKRFQSVVERIKPSEKDFMSFHSYAYLAAGLNLAAGLATGFVFRNPMAGIAETAAAGFAQRQLAKIMTTPGGAMAAANLMAAIVRQAPRGIDAAVRQFSAASRNAEREEQPGMPPVPVPPGLRPSPTSKPSLVPRQNPEQETRRQQLPPGYRDQPVVQLSREETSRIVDKSASDTGVDRRLLQAMRGQESGGQPGVISPKTAMGDMQLMPDTARDLNVRNPFDPRENIPAGARYMRDMLVRYKGNIALALAAYNAGTKAVDKYGGIPPYPETQNYVSVIMARYRKALKPTAYGPVLGIPGQVSSPVTAAQP